MATVTDFALPLDQPILDGGLPAVNFFNGRLLTAGDMRREQDAARAARLRLGRVLGDGVADGLEVGETVGLSTADTPVVTVQPGTAINLEGAVLELQHAVNLRLVRRRPADASAEGGGFADCLAAQPGVYSVGAGLYLLTIQPASGEAGRAPASGLPDVAKPACTTDRRVEGVRFRLVAIALDPDELLDPRRLRSRFAHRCFGTDDPARLAVFTDPFGSIGGEYGLVAALRSEANPCIGDADVPLAALLWTADGGLEFIDLWAVRRRLSANDALEPMLGARPRAEAEARLLQFQAQIGDLMLEGRALDGDTADDHFVALPPAGLLPAAVEGSAAGFDPAVFFQHQAPGGYQVMDARDLRPLLEESLAHEALPVDGQEVVDLFLIRENRLAVREGRARQLAVVFARRNLHFRGTARYGEAEFGTSRHRRP